MTAAVPVGTRVRVRVPASSANLGPGFDSVGLALGVWDECEVIVTDAPGLAIEVTGQGGDAVPRDESHLVVRTMRRTWAELGVRAPRGLLVRCINAVPHGRGMGSSATAIVTGIVVAQALSNAAAGVPGFDTAFVNSLAARLEGHPDNASASVFGGATLSVSDDPDVSTTTVCLPLDASIVPVVFVPGEQLSTAKARAVLPDRVALAEAAANSARVGLLVHALTQDPSLLLPATVDLLHQEPRRASYAASMALVDRLRADGHAAVISGAGPSVLVLSTDEVAPSLAAYSPQGWDAILPGIPERGAHLVP
ncbi:MAG: homoserine kinase [Phycicoccus sp.]|nr:homoserine kinase [Phycicoccus sp.]